MGSTQLIVLNGGSSVGKSTIARCLQAVLPEPWLTVGVDTLITALPMAGAGIEVGPGGEVVMGPEFRILEAAWMTGIAALDTSQAEALTLAQVIAAQVSARAER